MKNLVALMSALFVVTLMAIPAQAIEEGDVGMAVTVGQFGPTGDLADYYRNNLGVAAQVGYFVEDVLSINAGGVYSSFDADEGDGKATVTGFYLMPEFIQPVYEYFLPGFSLGAGFYSTSVDVAKVTDTAAGQTIEKATESGTVFGLNAGLSIRFLLGEKFMMGINGRYHLLFPTEVKVADEKQAAMGNIQTKDFDITSDFYHIGLEVGVAF